MEPKVSDQPVDPQKQGGEGNNVMDDEVVDVGFVEAGSKNPKRKRRARKHSTTSYNSYSDSESMGPSHQRRRLRRSPDKSKVSSYDRPREGRKSKSKRKHSKSLRKVFTSSELARESCQHPNPALSQGPRMEIVITRLSFKFKQPF